MGFVFFMKHLFMKIHETAVEFVLSSNVAWDKYIEQARKWGAEYSESVTNSITRIFRCGMAGVFVKAIYA